MSQGLNQSSFAQVLAGWAEQEKDEEPFSYARPSINEISSELPINFQNTYIGESLRDCEIRLYGVNEEGSSILVRVQDFRHYFFLVAPDGFSDSDREPLRNHANKFLNEESHSLIESPIYDIQIVQKKLNVHSLALKPYLQVFFNPRAMDRVRRTCKYKKMFNYTHHAYGSQIPYVVRFRIDYKMEPMQWLQIPANQYAVISMNDRVSNCQLELLVNANALEAIERADFAPFRILSFDIETDVPENGTFPTSDQNPVFQIGCTLAVHGQLDDPPLYRTIFTVDTCSAISGAHVRHFETEAELLTAWQQFFIDVDPDIVTGYNFLRFDTPYLLERARILGLSNFAFLGRIRNFPQVLPTSMGNITVFNSPECDGRLLLDMAQYMYILEGKSRGPGWHKLDTVCFRILGERKEEMDPLEIPELQGGGPDDRRRLATYCLKDTYLPLRLMSHLNCIKTETDRAKNLRLPMNMLRRYDLTKDSNMVKGGLEAVDGNYVHW